MEQWVCVCENDEYERYIHGSLIEDINNTKRYRLPNGTSNEMIAWYDVWYVAT